MLAAERQAWVVEVLRQEGRLVAKDLAERLDVSEDTVRRDLRELAAEGLLIRVHGGAMPVSPATRDYAARTTVATDSKQRVARLAAALIQDGQTAFVDGGTTALAVCEQLPASRRATVVTHAPTVAVALNDHPGVDVLLIGGRIYPHSIVAVGAIAVEQLDGMRADVFLMGVSGIDAEAGLTTGDAEEAAIKRAMLRRAADTYVLASDEKLATTARFRVAGLDEVTAAVTDAPPDDPRLAALRSAGLAVLGS